MGETELNKVEETGLIKIESSEVKIDALSIFTSQLKKGTEVLKDNKVINNANDLIKANDNLGKGKKLINLINKEVTKMCGPLKDQKRKIDEAQRKLKEKADELCKELTDLIAEVEKAILAFNKLERDRVSKELADQQTAIVEKQAEIKNLGPLASDEVIEEAKKEAEKVIIQPVISAPAIKGLTVTWKYEIENEDLIPRQYCSSDASKIQTAVRSGTREIPGVRIYQDEKIRAGR